MGILKSIGTAILSAIADSEAANRYRQQRAAMAPAEAAANTICKAFDYQIGNLELQKLLYLCERECLGRTGASLIGSMRFHSTDFGPRVTALYKRINAHCGVKPVRRAYFGDDVVVHGRAGEVIAMVCDAVKAHPSWGTSRQGGLLVSLTHLDGGAWGNAYHPGLEAPIRQADIKAEYAMVHQVHDARAKSRNAELAASNLDGFEGVPA